MEPVETVAKEAAHTTFHFGTECYLRTFDSDPKTCQPSSLTKMMEELDVS